MIDLLLERPQPLLALAGFSLFWSWESFRPFFGRSGRVRHAARNLTITAVNVVMVALAFSSLTVATAEIARQQGFGLLRLVELPEAARLAAAVVVLDVWGYWWHRANHVVPLLWRFHRVHHSDPQMDVSTATRFHFGEIAISSTLRLALIPLFGIPLAAIVIYEILLLLSTQFHHADLRLAERADRLVRLGVVSPDMHKIHHSRVWEETDSNYSSVLSLWDRLFGTYREKRDCSAIRFGLEGQACQSVTGLLATPFRKLGAPR